MSDLDDFVTEKVAFSSRKRKSVDAHDFGTLIPGMKGQYGLLLLLSNICLCRILRCWILLIVH
jgi:hypothetical protein